MREPISKRGDVDRIGDDTPRPPQPGREEMLRPVERLGLHILAERERHRPAISRIEQRRHRMGQGIEQLLGPRDPVEIARDRTRSEEHTSELQSLMRISYAVFCLKKKKEHTIT